MPIKKQTEIPSDVPITRCPPADLNVLRTAAKKRYAEALDRERWLDVDTKARRSEQQR